MMDHEFPIAQEQADTFLSEALPLLKDVGEVTVSEDVSSDIVEYPLRARLSLEEKDGRIIGDLKYFYGMYEVDRKSTRLNSSHVAISYAVFCLKKKKRKAATTLIYLSLQV